MARYVGIDPGRNGGIAWLDDEDVHAEKLAGKTERDIWELIATLEDDDTTFAMIECARSSPQMGVTSAFTFGRGFGELRMALIASGIAFEEVSARVWQRHLRCVTKGDKNVTKRKAQELFPALKITADTLLIAEYARRTRMFPR